MHTFRNLLLLVLFSVPALFSMSWKIRPSADLRTDALKLIQDYVKDFPQDAGVAKANAILHDETIAKDLHAWMRPTLELSLDILKRHPIAPENEAIRKAALHILDYPIHVNNGAKDEPGVMDTWRNLMSDYHVNAYKEVAASVKATQVPEGKIAIWKLYNMGYILKTAHHCVGFDLVRIHPLGPKNVNLLNEPVKELLDQIECMFISHYHSDHFQYWMHNHLFAKGKPVFVPELPPSKEHPAPNRSNTKYTYVWDCLDKPMEYNGITFYGIPGHQEKLLNTNFVITLDGITVMQTGDNCDRNVFQHFSKVGRVDVLIGTCWAFIPRNGLEIAKNNKGTSTQPQFYITGHENELGHGPTNRESFQETYKRLGDRSKLMPTFILNVGEALIWPDGTAISK